MSRFVQLFTVALLAVVFAADEAAGDGRSSAEGKSRQAVGEAVMRLLRVANSASGADVQGLAEVIKAGEAWLEEDSKEKAEKIIEALTKAADAPHDIFSGLRIFATSLRKAVDSDDEAALTKALGMRDKFHKTTVRFINKVEEEARVQAQKKKEQAKADAEKKSEEEAAAGGDEDDDADFDSEDEAPSPEGASADEDDEF